MMKRLIKYLVLILIPVFLISSHGLTQTNNYEYPKLYITENGDTLLLITVSMVKKLNILYLEKDKFKTLTDSLNKQVNDYELIVIQDKELINNLKEQLILKNNIINEKDGIVEELTDKNKKIEKKLKRNVFFNKVLIVGGIILGIIVII